MDLILKFHICKNNVCIPNAFPIYVRRAIDMAGLRAVAVKAFVVELYSILYQLAMQLQL